MSKLRDISGKKLVLVFEKFGFVIVGQKGSHIKMSKLSNKIEILVIPSHSSIAKGTLKAIYTQALAYIPESDLKRIFYS